MIKILIIEDEEPAAERLVKMLLDIDTNIVVVGNTVSVKSSVKWFRENPLPDLILMDINLSDGHSFDIFKEVEISAPIIFITAYDQYAIDAFKLNSIDYILKPIKKEELRNALDKYKRMGTIQVQQVTSFLNTIKSNQDKEFQKRIVIRYGDTIKMIEITDIAYFYTEEKINFLCTHADNRMPIDQNLDELEEILNPKIFFRINRQFIINIAAIEKMLTWSKSRVKIILKPASEHETIVSTERSSHFKDWLIGK
jgi:two-component system LytT family response regulator